MPARRRNEVTIAVQQVCRPTGRRILAVADGPLAIVASSTLLAILLVRLVVLTCGCDPLARFTLIIASFLGIIRVMLEVISISLNLLLAS